MLFDRMRATVMTSATLTVEGSFDYVQGPPWRATTPTSLRVPSEFDFAEQAILYLPRKMPPPKSPRFADAVAREVIELLMRTEGRAFVLFTSYAMLRAVRDRVERELPYPMHRAGHRAAQRAAQPVPRRRPTPCCSRPRLSGRASTSSASS